ncbi:MAG: hypothetical protein Q8M66_06065, partial [Actinomycetota bacterium]|nr:hypothetical protein [Actinomycetota bacterium]
LVRVSLMRWLDLDARPITVQEGYTTRLPAAKDRSGASLARPTPHEHRDKDAEGGRWSNLQPFATDEQDRDSQRHPKKPRREP